MTLMDVSLDTTKSIGIECVARTNSSVLWSLVTNSSVLWSLVTNSSVLWPLVTNSGVLGPLMTSLVCYGHL